MSITPCPSPTAVPTGVVVFDPAVFKAAFTSFATVADAALDLSFELAQLQLANTCRSAVQNAQTRSTLLNLLVAHITALKDGENGLPPAGVVGRVSEAAEGSVRVSADMGTVVYGQAYYLQTQWGALYWQSTARFRTMRYVPAPLVCADIAAFPGYNGGGFPGGGCGGGC